MSARRGGARRRRRRGRIWTAREAPDAAAAARDPVKVNLLMRDFVRRVGGAAVTS